ncbi:MAG: Tim44 domain-containing protein [Magnetococcales bacterium]|nr:Tim44 domain-containing protein [Magnetococcales bacterium]
MTPRKRLYSAWIATLALILAVSLTVWPEDAEAKRMGGGGSIGSRGSKSFSTPQSAPAQRSPVTAPASPSQAAKPGSTTQTPAAAPQGGRFGGMMGGLMGGLAGFALGGLLGSMLFGGGMGGMGLLDILLIGGLIWFVWRMVRRSRAPAPEQPLPASAPYSRDAVLDIPPASSPMDLSKGSGGGSSPVNLSKGSDGGTILSSSSTRVEPTDPVTAGLNQIAAQDPRFDELQFLAGARRAFEMVQGSWVNWDVQSLKPLLTDRMLSIAEQQAREMKAAGQKSVIEKIVFQNAEVSEAWQESGEDWITVHFVVSMLDYTLDAADKVVDGDAQTPVGVEEYWTFTRSVGATDPNWKLSAIQQSGEVARSAV